MKLTSRPTASNLSFLTKGCPNPGQIFAILTTEFSHIVRHMQYTRKIIRQVQSISAILHLGISASTTTIPSSKQAPSRSNGQGLQWHERFRFYNSTK